MKGYWVNGAYKGWIPSKGEYIDFENDGAYVEYYREMEE